MFIHVCTYQKKPARLAAFPLVRIFLVDPGSGENMYGIERSKMMSTVLLDQASSRHREVAFPWGFLALTFGFAWLLLLPGVLALYNLVRLPFPAVILVAVAQFGPSLAAFLLTYHQRGKAGVKAC